MDSDQIKEQRKLMDEDENKKIVNLLSDQYSREPINRNYEKTKDNKIVGALLIVLIVIILIILGILKVM